MKMTAGKIRTALIVLLAAAFVLLGFGAVEVNGASVSDATGYVNSRVGVNVRSGPGTRYKIAFGLGDNAKVIIHEEYFVTNSSTSSVNRWYRVSRYGRSGYIRADLIDGVSYTTVNGVTTDGLNYRNGAGTGMYRAGTLGKGTGLAVVLKARANNSSAQWYKVKIGSSYRYVCGTWVNLTGSIFTKPENPSSGNSGNNWGSQSGNNSGNTGGNTAQPSSFEDQLNAQGFPEDYKVQLRKLHQAHPNWVFQSINTGLDFNTVVSKESAGNVSLINGAYPLSYRSTAAGDFRAGNGRTVYSSTSTSSSSAGHIANNESFTILDEKFTSNSTASSAKWTHVKLSNGSSGYINGAITSESYGSSIKGVGEKDTNIRSIAGTASGSYVRTLNADTTLDIVLSAKDSKGTTWYKFRDGSTYRYICADYVKLQKTEQPAASQPQEGQQNQAQDQPQNQNTQPAQPSSGAVTGKATDDLNYRVGPGAAFQKKGMFNRGQELTILSSVTSCDNNGWYKVNYNGEVVYVCADYVSVSGTVSAGTATVPGTVKEWLNYRSAPSMSASRLGTLSAGTSLTITGSKKADGYTWYRANYNGKDVYVASDWVTIGTEKSDVKAGASGSQAQQPQQSQQQASQAQAAAPADPSSLNGTGKVVEGSYIPKDGSNWFAANAQTVAYFVDPRNFLNEDRIYMFENLSYNGSYQTVQVVDKILAGTALQRHGYQASWFTSAGAKYGISPVSLAARARQETGGGSIAESGYMINGITYYNPFNIGAYTSSNPVMLGMQYAQKQGWNTKQAAIDGAAKFLASGYINNKQNTMYLERFNVANGASRVATHQYMTNIMAPYSESLTTKNAYSSYGITNEALVFLIPVYTNMPGSTSLPS